LRNAWMLFQFDSSVCTTFGTTSNAGTSAQQDAKRSGPYGRDKAAGLGALFLYGRHAMLNKAHRSGVAVRPELRAVA
jgi:hypothetical protein